VNSFSDELSISVYDHNRWRSDEFIGELRFSVRVLTSDKELSQWHALLPARPKVAKRLEQLTEDENPDIDRGSVFVRILFQSTAPIYFPGASLTPTAPPQTSTESLYVLPPSSVSAADTAPVTTASSTTIESSRSHELKELQHALAEYRESSIAASASSTPADATSGRLNATGQPMISSGPIPVPTPSPMTDATAASIASSVIPPTVVPQLHQPKHSLAKQILVESDSSDDEADIVPVATSASLAVPAQLPIDHGQVDQQLVVRIQNVLRKSKLRKRKVKMLREALKAEMFARQHLEIELRNARAEIVSLEHQLKEHSEHKNYIIPAILDPKSKEYYASLESRLKLLQQDRGVLMDQVDKLGMQNDKLLKSEAKALAQNTRLRNQLTAHHDGKEVAALCRSFGLSSDEFLIDSVECHQGKLYLFTGHLCFQPAIGFFHSKRLKAAFPLNEIKAIDKTRSLTLILDGGATLTMENGETFEFTRIHDRTEFVQDIADQAARLNHKVLINEVSLLGF
jgi:GRAM domain/C2 domain